MEESAYIGGAIAGLFYLVAGIRLTWLSLQTGEAPERLLAATFLLWGLSYIAWQIPIALANEWMSKWCFFAGRLLTDVGTVSFALFLRLVFRPQERWPTGLIGVVIVCMIAGIIGSAMVGDWEGVQPLGNPWWWLESVGFPITVVWMGIEGFHQNQMARQRMRLGLCEPMICNRYLLWGLTGVTWAIYQFAMIAQQIEYEMTGVWSASMDSLVGMIELTAIALIYLVFFPPAFYRHWINRATPTLEAPDKI